MFASPVLTNIKGFSYTTVIVSHQWEKSNLFQSHTILYALQVHEPHVTWTSLWFYEFCLSCTLPVVLQFNVLVAKRQQHSPTWSSLPASPLFLSTGCFQAGRLSVERPQTAPKYMWFNESMQKLKSRIWKLSEITSKRIVSVVFPGRSTPLSCL